MLFRLFLVPLLLVLAPAAGAQDAPIFTEDFPAAEFQARRRAVMDAIGPGAIALLQGAPSPPGYIRFRQTNSFYYLSGVETPHAYLVLNGTTGRSSLYLPPQDVRRESSEGRLLTSDDADLARERTGVAEVHPSWKLSDHLARLAWSPNPPVVHTPLAPAELAAMSRDLATRGNSDIANDPWDARSSREATFVSRLEGRFPRLEVRDLTPVLDRARLLKSEHEISLITKATRLSGLALMEAMRSTTPGIYERELDAVGKFLFFRDGAQSDAYYSLVATGTNAWYPHYHRGASQLQDGDLILMDYAPDVGYYTSDVTRMWPVNGVFNEWQRDLYGFYLACYQAILDAIRPGGRGDGDGRGSHPHGGDRAGLAVHETPLPAGRGSLRGCLSSTRRRPSERYRSRRGDGGPRCRQRGRDAHPGHGVHHRAPIPGARGSDLHPPGRRHPHHRGWRRDPLGVRSHGH